MKNAEYYIKHLNLKPHLEGGYYMESFHGEDKIKTGIAEGIEKERFLWTSIYFMLCTGEVSHFHRLESDELWYYHDGEALTIYMISPEGQLITKQLGCHMENNEQPQILVPKGYIFGSAMNQDGFALVGCMVSPGFDYKDFKLYQREELLQMYPQYEEVIKKLTSEA